MEGVLGADARSNKQVYVQYWMVILRVRAGTSVGTFHTPPQARMSKRYHDRISILASH